MDQKKENPILGGRDYLGRLREKLKTSSTQGGKKDTSALGGKPFLPFGKFATRVEKDPSWNIYEKTKIKTAKRKDLVNKFYLKEIMGSGIDAKDIKTGKEQLALGSQGKYKKLSPLDRKEMKKIIDAFPESKS